MEVDPHTIKEFGKWLLGGIGVIVVSTVNAMWKHSGNVDRRINSLEAASAGHAQAMLQINEHVAGMRADVQKMTVAIIELAGKP